MLRLSSKPRTKHAPCLPQKHQVGGFGNIVAGAILRNRKNFRQSLQLDMVGVADCFGISGNPSELMQHFGLTAEHIAKRVLDLLDKKLATYQSLDLCAACRIERGKVTRNSTYVCLACRAKPVLR
jgi:hypothetical protein